MSWLSKALHTVQKIADPVGTLIGDKVVANNPNNGVVSFLAPGAKAVSRMDNGEPMTLKTVGDPGNYFTPSVAQQQAWKVPGQQFAAQQQARINQRLGNLQGGNTYGNTNTLNYVPAHNSPPPYFGPGGAGASSTYQAPPGPMNMSGGNVMTNGPSATQPQVLQSMALRQWGGVVPQGPRAV